MRYSPLMVVFLTFLAFSTATAQNLNSAEEYSQRGIARFEKNDFEGAIADFTKAIELNGPNLEFCYYFRGIARYRQGNIEEAIVDLGKAIAIRPHPRFFDDRGNLLARKGDFDGALADLNKALELAPQYAKGYGDRALVHLMRGDNAKAELDFKKCFELAKALEAPMRAAADQIRQQALLSQEHQKPSDLEVIKFSCAEAAASELIPGSPTLEVSQAPVSPSGTRILADSNAKGDPGPSLRDPALSTSGAREPGTRARTRLETRFTISVKNIGAKTIMGVRWGYFFYPKDKRAEPAAYVFATTTSIAPGKEKTINEPMPVSANSKQRPPVPHKNARGLYNERVAILRLDYADGTTWQSRSSPGEPQ